MAGAKSRSKTEQERCKRYQAQNVYGKNKRKKLEKRVKEHPNDEVAINALKDIKWRRKTPGAQHWSKSDIATVKLYILAGRSGKDFLADKAAYKKRLTSNRAKQE